jgi:hypothetical protein
MNNFIELGRVRFKSAVAYVYPEWADCVDYLDDEFFNFNKKY